MPAFTPSPPAESVVWRRYASGDAAIKADSPLVDLIDPAEVFIDAVIYERDLSRVKPGDTARVRLPGSGKEWKAEVKQVFGRSLPWPDQLLATQPAPSEQRGDPRPSALQRAPRRRRGRRVAARWASGPGDLCFHGRRVEKLFRSRVEEYRLTNRRKTDC